MRVAILAVMFMTTGCVTANTDIEGRDSGLFLPSIRARLGGNDTDTVPSQSLAFVDIELAVVGGEDSQVLAAGQTVVFDSHSFAGPARLEHEWELTALNLVGYGGLPLGKYASIGMLAGVTFNTLGIRVESATQSDREHTIAIGPGIGLRLAVTPAYWVTIYAQALTFYALSDHSEVDLQTAEVGAHFHVNESVGLILGWRSWEYDGEATEETIIGLVEVDESDIELENHGFMASLVFSF